MVVSKKEKTYCSRQYCLHFYLLFFPLILFYCLERHNFDLFCNYMLKSSITIIFINKNRKTTVPQQYKQGLKMMITAQEYNISFLYIVCVLHSLPHELLNFHVPTFLFSFLFISPTICQWGLIFFLSLLLLLCFKSFFLS